MYRLCEGQSEAPAGSARTEKISDRLTWPAAIGEVNMATKAAKKFPEKIFVKLENIGTEDEYFETNEDPKLLLETEDEISIGEYELVRTLSGTLEPKFK